MGVRDSSVCLRKRTAVSLVEGWGGNAWKFDHFSQGIALVDACDRLCIVLRGHCGPSDVRAARVPLVLWQVSAAQVVSKEWFTQGND